MGQIKECQFIIPIPQQSYSDTRPTITGESWEDIRQTAAEVAYSIGNTAYGNALSGTTQTASTIQKVKIAAGGTVLFFDPTAHTYEDAASKPYLTGSTFASMFEEPFKADIIAPKVAEKKLTTTDKVLASWELKNQVSCDYGTAVHKSVELAIKYNEFPNNPHLAMLAQDVLDIFADYEPANLSSEQFVCDPTHRLCGTIDLLVNEGNKHVRIFDIKSNDIEKKVTLTKQARSLWPDLPAKLSSIYALQLSFYAYILEQQGYKVDELTLLVETAGAFASHPVPHLNITRALEAVWK